MKSVASVVNVPTRVVIAMHAVAMMAKAGGRRLRQRDIAKALGFSEAHLTKVIPVLVRAGLVKTIPGPLGGVKLNPKAGQINLRRVFEAMEGPMEVRGCPFRVPSCRSQDCALGKSMAALRNSAVDFLATTPATVLRAGACEAPTKNKKRK